MNDRQERQPLKTVSFKEESSQDKVNESILMLTQMMERQLQLAEKQENDNRSRGRKREEIVGIGSLDYMIDPAHMIDQVHMIGQRVEKDQIVEIEVGIEVIEMIEVVETKVEIKIQETRGTIQVQDIPPVCFVIIVK